MINEEALRQWLADNQVDRVGNYDRATETYPIEVFVSVPDLQSWINDQS